MTDRERAALLPETHVVVCPQCGQMELWTEWERYDHGKCRASLEPCFCGDDTLHPTDLTP